MMFVYTLGAYVAVAVLPLAAAYANQEKAHLGHRGVVDQIINTHIAAAVAGVNKQGVTHLETDDIS